MESVRGHRLQADDVPDAILGEAAQITADLSRLEPQFVARARVGDEPGS